MKRRSYLIGSGSSFSAAFAGCIESTGATGRSNNDDDDPDGGGDPDGGEVDDAVPRAECGEGIAEVKARLAEVEGAIDELRAENAELESRVETITSENAELEERVSELEGELDDIGESDGDSNDTDGPTIHDFSLSGEEFEPGDVMEIDVEVTDETDIETISFHFEHEDGGEHGPMFVASRDFSPPVGDGTHTIACEMPADVPAGTYEATWIFARDSIGTRETWTDSFAPEKRRIEIVSDVTDTEPPTIRDFSLSGREFEPGDVMAIDVEVTDETAIYEIYFRFVHEEGDHHGPFYDVYRRFSPAVDDGTYTIEYEWPADVPAGTYEAEWIFATDSLGNKDDRPSSFPSEKSEIEIVSDVTDTEAPTIHDFSLSGGEFEPGDVMAIDVEVTDETDIHSISFHFEHQDGGERGPLYSTSQIFSPPLDDGTHTLELEWPEDAPTGTYEASWISTGDSIGNDEVWTNSFPDEKKRVEVVDP